MSSGAIPDRTPQLRVQINQIDHTLIQPGPLDNSTLPRVPIIRIYGSSTSGKKACVHVHQVYPYIYVDYRGRLNLRHVNHYISRLTHSLNHAIALSLKRDPNAPNSQYIRGILLVKGIHFYGFHSSYSPFLKVFVSNPSYVNRTATILQSGSVMGTRFRVFESHLSYILQFMCDFGLYGCGWLDVSDVLQRGAEETNPEESGKEGEAHFKASPYFRQTRMPLEVDVIAPQILNRHQLRARNIHHKLEIPASASPSDPLVLSVHELWEDERKRRRAHGLNPSPEIPVDPSDSRRGLGGDWVAEAMWWEEVRNRIERERETDLLIEENSGDWEKWTMSTFESTEALWEAPWKVWNPGKGDHTQGRKEADGSRDSGKKEDQWDIIDDQLDDADHRSFDVDTTMLSSQEISQMIKSEEAEWERLIRETHLRLEDENEDDIEDYIDQEGPDECIGRDAGSPAEASTEIGSGQANISPPDPFVNGGVALGGIHEKVLRFSSPPTLGLESHLVFDVPVTPTKFGPSPDPPLHRSIHSSEMMHLLESPNLHAGGSHDLFSNLAADSQHVGPYVSAIGPLSAQVADDTDETRPSKRRALNFSLQHEVIPQLNPFSLPQSPSKDLHKKLSIPMKSIRQSHNFRTMKKLNMNRYCYAEAPPMASDLVASLCDDNLPRKIYRAPYYSKALDAPERPREYAGLMYHLKSGEGVDSLEDWDNSSVLEETYIISGPLFPPKPFEIGGWEFAGNPPDIKCVKRWLASSRKEGRLPSENRYYKIKSQIEGPTQKNIYGLKDSLGNPPGISRERQSMGLLSMEVFVPTREERVPDAEIDEIAAVFYAYRRSEEEEPQSGTIIIKTAHLNQRHHHDGEVQVVPTELELINRITDIVVDLDPDIIVGWEVERASWGYLSARGRQYGYEVSDLISRAPFIRTNGLDQWGTRHTSTFKVAGRHVLNVWRIMRSEQRLTSYTFENIVFNVLQQRIPRYTFSTLSEWYRSKVPAHVANILGYFSNRASLVLAILERTETITKTAEFARVFGVDFFSVISRGSQFKVEAFMFRIAKPESFVLLSPSKQDVGKQNAAECMPLIMEPSSAFYSSPVIVLDFQSLYPSIMIAYNYCYSTCLGRAREFQGRNKLGVVDLDQTRGMLETLADHIHISPNGIIFVKPEVRKGLLGRMLVELLETRVMIKQALKGVKNDKALQRILDARQLSLKYICNVTYGYTSATYSGRMPAVEIADSIVQSGRETLEKAIKLINGTKKWGAEVVYGDTDSVFVYLRGKSKDQAFRIGNEIADTITALNPSPVKLKFEKVYLPCVLMAKKRYVGFKYEHIDDDDPIFDAKGIETVRRDGVSAQQKMTEICLKILFRTQDLSAVKKYCYRSWTNLLENRASIQDFIFAKEVKMGTYSEKIPPPPGVAVAARKMIGDPNNEPQYGERIPYVIIRGKPNSRLIDRAVDPLDILGDSRLRLDATYYISRVLIPPLERIFNVIGANVQRWFDEMPKTHHSDLMSPTKNSTSKPSDHLDIDEHFYSSQCLVCGDLGSQGLCNDCYFAPQETIANLSFRIQANERRLTNAHRICTACTGSGPDDPIRCESLDCPWLFSRKRAENKRDLLAAIQVLLNELNEEINAPSEDEDFDVMSNDSLDDIPEISVH